MTTENILGHNIATKTVDGCTDYILELLESTVRFGWLACFNPHSYVVGRTDTECHNALSSADLLVPDGFGVVLASKILRGRIRNRVTGYDIFSSLCAKMNELGGMSVFFLGSSAETLQKIEVKMRSDFPNIAVAGTYSPPFKSEFSRQDLDDMTALVNRVSPDILLVGLTAPKQEKLLAALSDKLDVRFALAIGAVFDFYVGNVNRSHWLFQKLGLEWLPRLIQEPRRLWRRTLVSAPVFVWHVLKARFGRYPGF